MQMNTAVDATNSSSKNAEISAEDQMRVDLYALLGLLLAKPASAQTLEALGGLVGEDSEIGHAVNTLAGLARKMAPKTIESEFNALFIGLGRGELLPYASFYMTGFLNEKPLAQLRRDMKGIGVTRAENVYEPEDNIASLCEMMAGLISGAFGQVASLKQQNDFFRVHLGSWAAHFFSDLEAAQSSVFYAPVGTIGRLFVQIESEAFRIEA